MVAAPDRAIQGHKPGDEFGFSVAISGSVAVAGGYNSDGKAAGPVYVFARTSKTWHLQTALSDPEPLSQQLNPDSFGYAVAVSSTRNGPEVLVGAPSAGPTEAGVIYVYARSGGTWHRQATLAEPSSCACNFGSSLAVSGATAVIGEQSRRANSGSVVYVYARSGARWHRQATLRDPVTGNDQFGQFPGSVAVSSGVAVVGAEAARRNHGLVYIFAESGSAWHRRQILPDPAAAGTSFGSTVAISRGTVMVSAIGAAYVFRHTLTGWRRPKRLAVPRSRSVLSVALDGGRAVVGDSNAGTHRCGEAFEYVRTNSGWPFLAVVANHGCSSGDLFGWSVAVSGKTAVIGAPGKDRMTGSVYVAGLR